MNTNTLELIAIQRIVGMKASMDTLRKEVEVGVTCWELKFHLFKALVLPTFIHGNEKLGR